MFALSLGKRQKTVALKHIAAMAIAVLALTSGGCTSWDAWDNFNHCSGECCRDYIYCGWRDHVWAKRSFHQHYPTCGHLHPGHFRRGFMEGYTAVCSGEDQYMPAVPPKDYWGYEYQSMEGNQMVDAWFAGYPEGVKAAQQEGAGQFRDVQISTMLNAAMQPDTSVWAPYSTDESTGDPPIISGQDMEMPPAPEAVPTTSLNKNGMPLAEQNNAGATANQYLSPTAPANQPIPARRAGFSWGLIR